VLSVSASAPTTPARCRRSRALPRVNPRRDDISSSATASCSRASDQRGSTRAARAVGGRGLASAPRTRRSAHRCRAGGPDGRTGREHPRTTVMRVLVGGGRTPSAVRGHASGQTVGFIGPPRTVLAIRPSRSRW
jgi:hypothetical protein